MGRRDLENVLKNAFDLLPAFRSHRSIHLNSRAFKVLPMREHPASNKPRSSEKQVPRQAWTKPKRAKVPASEGGLNSPPNYPGFKRMSMHGDVAFRRCSLGCAKAWAYHPFGDGCTSINGRPPPGRCPRRVRLALSVSAVRPPRPERVPPRRTAFRGGSALRWHPGCNRCRKQVVPDGRAQLCFGP